MAAAVVARGAALAEARGRWVLVAIIIAILLPIALSTGVLGLVFGGGKSYDFPRVEIDATVLQDGSLELVERRTFDFRGSFSEAFFSVAEPFDRVRDFTVTEGGTPVAVNVRNVGTFEATWPLSVEDERRTYTIAYRVLCAVDVWADTAHLNWQFIGSGWEVPTERAVIRLHLPGGATRQPERPPACIEPLDEHVPTRPLGEGQVQAWGHGPLGGQIELPAPDEVVLTVENLEPYTFVEGSVLFPTEVVPLAPEISVDRKAALILQERRDAAAANERRLELLEEERRQRLWRWIAWGAAAGIPIVVALLVLVAHLRDRVPGVPRYLQEPPEELHPMEVLQLWGESRGAINPRDAYRTALLQLARSGVIEIRAEGRVSDPEDLRVKLVNLPEDEGVDQRFAEFLFEGTEEWVSLASLKPTGKRRTRLRDWWKDVQASTKYDAARMRQGRWESRVVGLLGVGGFFAGAFTASLTGPWSLLVILSAIVSMVVGLIVMPTRTTPEFREQVGRWAGFRRFLRRFSSLPDAPALAVTVWEHYLVYAVALGVADRVEEQVRGLVAVEDLAAPWPGAPSGGQGLSWLGTFRDATPTSVAAAVMPPTAGGSTSSGIGSFSSSSGFSGGGFSGGGGGGGGGTGGGAR